MLGSRSKSLWLFLEKKKNIVVNRDFGYVHFCLEDVGRFCHRVQLSPLLLRLSAGVLATVARIAPAMSLVAIVWTMFACMGGGVARSVIGGRPHTFAGGGGYPRNGVLRGSDFSGCAREAPSMGHAVLATEVAKDKDVVDERWKARKGAQMRAAQIACQIVDLGNVRHKVALVRVFQEKVGGYSLFGP